MCETSHSAEPHTTAVAAMAGNSNCHRGATETCHGTTAADFHCQEATLDRLPDGTLSAMLPGQSIVPTLQLIQSIALLACFLLRHAFLPSRLSSPQTFSPPPLRLVVSRRHPLAAHHR